METVLHVESVVCTGAGLGPRAGARVVIGPVVSVGAANPTVRAVAIAVRKIIVILKGKQGFLMYLTAET